MNVKHVALATENLIDLPQNTDQRRIQFEALADLPASGATSRWVQADVGLHVLDYAGPVGSTLPPVVLVPGISMPAFGMDFVAKPLSHERRLLVLDVRGRGLSQSADDYSLAAYADDLAHVCSALDLHDAILVGHSMGARIVAQAAANGIPHKGSVIVDPPVSGPGRDPYPTRLSTFLAQVDEAYRGVTPDEVAASWPTWPRREQEIRSRWLASCEKMAVAATHHGFETENFFDAWQSLASPTVFMRGKDSPVVPDAAMREVREENPNAQVIEIPDSGHMVFWDNVASSFEALSQALRMLEGDL